MAEAYPATTNATATPYDQQQQQQQQVSPPFQPIEPQFNSNQPSSQSQQQTKHQDFTAPQQPYYVDPASRPTPEAGGDPYSGQASSGYTEFSILQRNLAFFKTIAGILSLVVFGLLFLAMVLMIGWRVHIGSFFHLVHGDGSAYFFFTTITPLFLLLGYLLMMLFGLQETRLLRIIEWNWAVIINSALWAFLLLISSSLVVKHVEKHVCFNHNCKILEAAAAFGFLSAFAFVACAIYYFKRWKEGNLIHNRLES